MPTIKLPQVGKSAQPATVRRWRKKVGEPIVKGDILLDVEAEEGSAEIESPAAGTLTEIFVTEGKTVPVNSPLANISDGASAPAASPAQATSSSSTVIPVLMPQAGQSMEEGTLIKWRVAVGDRIKKGDVIFEVETDKATMEVEATDTGRLSRIVLAEGGTSKVLIPVAFLAENDADVDGFLSSNPSAAPVATKNAAAPVTSAPVISAATTTTSGRVKASPAARKIAQERGIDIAAVPTGTGPNGRILSSDVPTHSPARTTSTTEGSRKKMSQMRKAIAKNLLASKHTIPHFDMKLTINAEPMYAFYQD